MLYSYVSLASLSLSPCLTPAAIAYSEDTSKDSSHDKLLRQGRKEVRKGNYDKALALYREILNKNAAHIQARLGASFAYLKMGDFLHCLEEAAEVLKLNKANARAHALAGTSLLRSGFVAAGVSTSQAIDLDPKDSLAYGGAAEFDYYRAAQDSRVKSLYAHNLDPDEPDFIITYARASSRVEDFRKPRTPTSYSSRLPR